MVHDRWHARADEFRIRARWQSAYNLVRELSGSGSSPEAVIEFFFDRLSTAPFEQNTRNDLISYLETGAAWTGSDAQLRTKAVGLARLIVGSGEYQIV